MKLIQFRYSHNCVKVRLALDAKGLDYEIDEINPAFRTKVVRESGQSLIPVLIDDEGRPVSDSTRIVLYLEERFPDRPLLPSEAGPRAECLLLEDWADAAFMSLTRRLAYWNVCSDPGGLVDAFFGPTPRLRRFVLGRLTVRAVSRRFHLSSRRYERDLDELRHPIRLAAERIDGRRFLVADRLTLADLGLASMVAPLWVVPELAGDEHVRRTLEWAATILGDEVTALYRDRRLRSSAARSARPSRS